jgi:pimeloyl-ACP methyl ester carboxylesterase
MTASKNPAAWFVQIRDAEHELMYQDPDQFNGIVSTFLKSVN